MCTMRAQMDVLLLGGVTSVPASRSAAWMSASASA
jgi:hypothetical protein